MGYILAILFLNPYFISPLILSCLLPLRWVKRFWIFVIIIGFGITAFDTQPSLSNGDGIGKPLGIFILITYAILISIIIIARIAFIKTRQKDKIILPTKSKAIIIADNLIISAGGIVTSIFIFKSMAFSLGAFSHGFLIHGALSIFILSLILGTWRLGFPKNHLSSKGRAFGLSLLGGLFLLIACGAAYPYLVIKNARSIAGERPACIALNQRERSVNSLEDLTFLTMDKTHFDHHAFLLVENKNHVFEPYHWSYIQSKFISGAVNWGNDNEPSISCFPKLNFYKNIPMIKNDNTKNMEFYMRDHFLQIPQEYSPRVSSNYISIAAIAPHFSSVKREERTLYPSMQTRSRDWIERLQTKHSNLPITGKIGNLNEVKNIDNHSTRYYRLNDQVQIETIIDCYDKGQPTTTACQHRFYKNNAMYTFYHSIELLPQSDKMETELFELFESFKEK